MSQVVDFRTGETALVAGEPNADLIRELEWLLEAARSGEVQALAGGLTYRDGSAVNLIAGMAARSVGLLGAVERAKHRLHATWDDAS